MKFVSKTVCTFLTIACFKENGLLEGKFGDRFYHLNIIINAVQKLAI